MKWKEAKIIILHKKGDMRDSKNDRPVSLLPESPSLDLRFTDDVALTTEGVKEMEHHLNTVNEESLKIGLEMYGGKTKFITNIDTTDNIHTDGTEIGKATNYRYRVGTTTMETEQDK